MKPILMLKLDFDEKSYNMERIIRILLTFGYKESFVHLLPFNSCKQGTICCVMTKQEEKEFEQLFKESYPQLYYYALTLINNSEICKDIVNDVFEQLWRDYEYLRQESAVSYLRKCVRNRCIDHLRHQAVEEQYVAFYALEFRESVALADGDEDERLGKIKKVIDAMSAQRRFIVEACFFHKKSYKEVAEILGMTVDGVKKHIVAALKKLRTEFSAEKVPEQKL